MAVFYMGERKLPEVVFMQNGFRRHMIAALEDTLREPISDVSLLVQHLREVATTITPPALEETLRHMQEKINQQAITFDTMRNLLVLQAGDASLTSPMESVHVPGFLDNISGRHPYVETRIVTDGAVRSQSFTMRCRAVALKRAMEDLLRAAHPRNNRSVFLQYQRHWDSFSLTVADHAAMLADEMFVAVDRETNLAGISPVTRQRLMPLLYAAEVAQWHGGVLEIKLWEAQFLAARLIVPQEDANST